MRFAISIIVACLVWFSAAQAIALDAIIVTDTTFCCTYGSIQFSALESTPKGYIDEVAWDWGAGGGWEDVGTMGEVGSIQHSWTNGGTYTVTLRVHQSGVGYDYETAYPIYVGEPKIIIGSSCIEVGAAVGFDGTSSLPGLSKTYQWDFDGNGSIDSTSGSDTWTYPSSGWNTCYLYVTYGGNPGWRCFTTAAIYVYPEDSCP